MKASGLKNLIGKRVIFNIDCPTGEKIGLEPMSHEGIVQQAEGTLLFIKNVRSIDEEKKGSVWYNTTSPRFHWVRIGNW